MSNTIHSSRHPAGLWVLFTTELWERFAFYTMRAILVLYLVSISTGDTPGFGWTESDAYKLYGWYTALVYLSPLLGGWLADRFIGARMCVIIGAVLMALGEFILAGAEFVRIGNTDVSLTTDSVAMWTFYVGLGVMILGNGFFKPCISTMVGQLYAPGDDRRRDAGFMIFYMGINIGAFMSPLIGGTVAEIYGYQYGFLIAGFGMIFGLISFLVWGKYLKGIGDPPAKRDSNTERTAEEKVVHEQRLYEQTRPLVKQDWDRIFVIFVLALFVMAFWIAFEQAGSSLNIFAKVNTDRAVTPVVQKVLPEGLLLKNEDFLELQGIVQKVQLLRDQLDRGENAIVEGPSFAERLNRFNIFRSRAGDKTEEISIRELVENVKADTEALRDRLQANVPTHNLVQDEVQVIYDGLIAVLDAISQGSIEGQIAEVKKEAEALRNRLRTSTLPEVQSVIDEHNLAIAGKDTEILEGLIALLDSIAEAAERGDVTERKQTFREWILLLFAPRGEEVDAGESVVALKRAVDEILERTGDKALAAAEIREGLRKPALAQILDHLPDSGADNIAALEKRRTDVLKEITTLLAPEQGKYGTQIQTGLLTMDERERIFDVRYEEGVEPRTFPATWYQSVNAMCVVIFVPIFMMLWAFLARLGIEPSTPTKFAIGLLLISLSFIVMIPGAIEAKFSGGKAAMYYLLLCYLIATWGELCLSPIGLSMITKLSPARYVSQFMGLWFLASSLSYLMAGYAASYFGSGEGISLFFGKDGGLADFFLLMAIIPFVIGIIALAMAPMLKRKMHGIH